MIIMQTTFLKILLLAVGFIGAGNRYAAAKDTTNLTNKVFLFEVAGMNCEKCAITATEALRKLPGVTAASVDFESGAAHVDANESMTTQDVRRTIADLSFEACFAGDAVEPPLTEDEKARLDIRTISRGRKVRIKSHLPKGKITIVDYYADWCAPCKILSPKIERILLRHDHVALRKIDISDWDSAAAKQATREFRLPGLPFVVVYNDKGRVLGTVPGNHVERIEALVVGSDRPKARTDTQNNGDNK